MTDELKPCPFCGAHPELQQIGNHYTKGKRGFQVVCKTWGCQAKHVSLTLAHPMEKAREWAIAAWNRRADHSPDAGKMAAEPADDLIAMVHAAPDPSRMPVLSDEDRATLVAEPAGDLVERVKAFVRDRVPTVLTEQETGDLTSGIVALFQPQMEAAEGLLRAAMTVLNELDTHGAASNDDWVKFGSAIDTARAAGLGRGSHD